MPSYLEGNRTQQDKARCRTRRWRPGLRWTIVPSKCNRKSIRVGWLGRFGSICEINQGRDYLHSVHKFCSLNWEKQLSQRFKYFCI